jgi:CRISPR-associated protein (TIGR03984 family)
MMLFGHFAKAKNHLKAERRSIMDLPNNVLITSIDTPLKFLDWLAGKADKPSQLAFEVKWALARCTDGITWGILHNGKWELANHAYPDCCPPIGVDNLRELRIFAEQGEVLLWQDECGLTGKLLADPEGRFLDCSACSSQQDINYTLCHSDPLAPFCREQILVGAHYKSSADRFVHVANSAGREQVLPIPKEELPADFRSNKAGKTSPFRLCVKYYVSQDPCGAVRISAARLVRLRVV